MMQFDVMFIQQHMITVLVAGSFLCVVGAPSP